MQRIFGTGLGGRALGVSLVVLGCSGQDHAMASGGSIGALSGGSSYEAGGTTSIVSSSSQLFTGGTSADAGGSTSASSGGLGSATGGSIAVGGTRSATGGTANTGGSAMTGGSLGVGGTINTGGAAVSGGSIGMGGTSTSLGGRGAGICPGGTYPTPSLTGTPTRIYNSGASGLFEGTVWLSNSSVLLFSNMSTNSALAVVPSQVQRLTPPSTVDVFLADSGTNGMALDANGSLIACSHKVQGLVTINTDTAAVATILNTDANGKHFNSPNDLTVRTDGTIYFTDPDYQLGSSRSSETGVKGVYRVSPTRQVSLVDGTFGEPNGIALSLDETALYVADMTANAIRKFSVAADGATSGKVTFASVTNPDGVAMDCAGNLYWASNSGGKVVIISPGGTQLGTITVAANLTNLAFGGADHKTLYMSVGTAIYSLSMNVPGLPY